MLEARTASAAGSGRCRSTGARRPRGRLARAEARRELRARTRGRRRDLQHEGEGRASPRRRRAHPALYGTHPEDQSLAVGSLGLRRPASTAWRSRSRSTHRGPRPRRGVGRAYGCVVAGGEGRRPHPLARDLFESAVRGLMTGDLNETSLFHLLYLVRGHGSINTLFSIEKGDRRTWSKAARVSSRSGSPPSSVMRCA